MLPEPGRWCRLIPETIAALPDAPAVFEIANLVRTVVYIGQATSLREELTLLAQSQYRFPPSPGGYYFRFEVTAAQDEAVAARFAAYRVRHGDALPPSNVDAPAEPPMRLRVAHRRAA